MSNATIINHDEYKTRRGNIILRPSTWTAIQKILKIEGGSFNDLVSTLLEDYAEKHSQSVYRYNQEHN